MNNDKNSALHKPAVSSRLISDAILNAKQLQQLYTIGAKIYSLATLTIILRKDNKAETICIDETSRSLLSELNKMIEHRTEQIKRFYK